MVPGLMTVFERGMLPRTWLHVPLLGITLALMSKR